MPHAGSAQVRSFGSESDWMFPLCLYDNK
uniref:Uncharacterized protein n=1 Tax=Arundo donax TaxID=35708 RepID=A0A0A9H301_ARUDO